MISRQKPETTARALGRYLRRFTISNVRTFRSPATINFCQQNGQPSQWTVILGENGTGKTTLLQYIAGMMPVPDEDLRKRVKVSEKEANGPPPFRPNFCNQEWFAWHAMNLPRPWGKPMVLTEHMEVSAAATSLQTAYADRKLDQAHQFQLTFGATPEGRNHISAKFTISAKLDYYEQFRLFGYGASRHVASPESPYLSSDSFFRARAISPVRTLFHDDHPLISPEQWLLGLDHISKSGQGKPAEAAKRALESARRCLARVLPDITEIHVRPFGLFEGKNAMTVLCKTPYGLVPFGQLGVGYRTMAAWLTDFLKRMHEAFTDLDDPNTGPAIVLIDEFDLHMHPRWQADAMRALSKEFPNTQFIVTAHSPLVVQAGVGTAKLVVLRRVNRKDGGQEVLIDSDPHYAAGWRVDQILSSDLYNLGSPRSATYTNLIEKRVRLLQKESLTDTEQQELEELDERLDREAPPGVSSASKKLFVDLKRALKKAEQTQKKK